MNYMLLTLTVVNSLIFSSSAIADKSASFEHAIINAALHADNPNTFQPTLIKGNTVKMVNFASQYEFKTTDKKLASTTWTTVEPELKELCAKYVETEHPSHDELALWIVQIIGVSPNNASSYRFVVMDVPVLQAYYGNPSNNIGIFRPCTDPRIGPHDDGTAICPQEMNSKDFNISTDYKTWFINYSISSYTLKQDPQEKTFYVGFPWTGYGYTYNWNPQASDIYGLSEFVVLKDTPVTILANPNDATTPYISAEEYCKI